MNDKADIETSAEFEAFIASRALALGVENLSRILPRLDATQSQILRRGMESVLSPRPTKLSPGQFAGADSRASGPKPTSYRT